MSLRLAPRRPLLRLVALALPLPFLAGGDREFAAGVRAWREGRTKEALESLAAAERAAGDAAPAELLWDLALAALADGDLRRAEIAAEKAAARGAGEFVARRDFVLGSAAFARGLRAQAQAGGDAGTAGASSQPGAPSLQGAPAQPFALDQAIAHVVAAEAAWTRAARSRDDWPQARRNVERAQRKLDELRQRKREAAKTREQPRTESRPKDADPKAPDAAKGKEEEVPLPPQTAVSGDARSVVDLLLAKEKEKRELRRVQQQVRTRAGEKGW